MAVPIHLHLICGCFSATMSELSGPNRDCMTCKAKNIYYLAIYKRKFADHHTLYFQSGCSLNKRKILTFIY